ncbi:circadian clock KaiB family protein [Rhizobium sp. NPDC090275]|uniref:circadian clock KaiB family protein n=1 Tax=Rhizobium sp. NPDC090275 TaxID=3364498 RepID=UPI00383B913F
MENLEGEGGTPKKLTLYVAGETPKSLAAIRNLERICSEELPGRYVVEVVDLKKQPHLAREHNIVAIPTLVRELPTPIRKVIGDLSNTEKVLINLQVSGAE